MSAPTEWMQVPCTCPVARTYGDHELGCPRALAFREAMEGYMGDPNPPDDDYEYAVDLLERALRETGDYPGPRRWAPEAQAVIERIRQQ